MVNWHIAAVIPFIIIIEYCEHQFTIFPVQILCFSQWMILIFTSEKDRIMDRLPTYTLHTVLVKDVVNGCNFQFWATN